MIQGVLLAAGRSRRFGADKLLHCLDDGVPVALASARTLRRVLDNVLVVVHPGAGALRDLLHAEGFQVGICARAEQGMGASLAFAVTESRGADGWLVALADMPFIRPETVEAVARLIEGGAGIAAPSWHGRRGHPVGFANRFGTELSRLGGDAGAGGLIGNNSESLATFACGDPGCVRDIDLPADLAAPPLTPSTQLSAPNR